MHEVKKLDNSGNWHGAQLTLVIAGHWQVRRAAGAACQSSISLLAAIANMRALHSFQGCSALLNVNRRTFPAYNRMTHSPSIAQNALHMLRLAVRFAVLSCEDTEVPAPGCGDYTVSALHLQVHQRWR